MVDQNMADAAQDAAASARTAVNAAQDYVGKGADAAREYANTGIDMVARVHDNLSEFVRNEPWISIAAAFAVGYVAARLIRRLPI
jgi:ElaB/YqjD/DUF883 family membrane-anchored ribosome-binding protein